MSWLTKSGGVIKAETIAIARYDHLRTFFIDSAVSNPIAAKNNATIGNSNNIPIGIVVMSKKADIFLRRHHYIKIHGT